MEDVNSRFLDSNETSYPQKQGLLIQIVTGQKILCLVFKKRKSKYIWPSFVGNGVASITMSFPASSGANLFLKWEMDFEKSEIPIEKTTWL